VHPHESMEGLRSVVETKADIWLMHSKAVQEGGSVLIRRDAGVLRNCRTHVSSVGVKGTVGFVPFRLLLLPRSGACGSTR